MAKTIWSALLAGAAMLALAAPVRAAPALWRVSDGDSRIYLFGTIHALTPNLAWRTPLYDRALAEATTVWFEADMEAGDPETIRLLVQRYGSDPDRPLSRKLAPSDLSRLSQQADLSRIDHLRPWAAALMLSMRPVLARGASVERGADLTITRVARADAKQVRAFETLEDQARMFAGLPEASEVRYLNGVVRGRTSKGQRLRLPFRPAGLESAWLSGRLGSDAIDGMRAENPALYEAFVRRRNLAWAERLTVELAGAGTELVNVGALHLVGDEGLPALLAARGYKVERIQ